MYPRSIAFGALLLLYPVSTNAQTWSPVGTGAASAVYALEVFEGDLYAGGLFTEVGGVNTNYIARWDGGAWSSIGSLASFMAADGLYANDTALFIGDGGRVRLWNGTDHSFLTGNSSSSFNSTAYSMAHFRDTLYVGGFFSTPFARVARWNGSGYEGLTSGCNAQVSDLLPFGDRLFVGGNFTLAGDSVVNHTALWNGTGWERMGAGVNDDVFTHCIFQDTLYIGGRFTIANGQTASRVAKWNGTQWVRVGGTLNDFVTAMTVYRDQLYIGGAFTSPAHIARLSGNNWVPVGTGCNDRVRTMEVYHDSLFVGGSFTMAGGIPADRIAKWHTPAAPVAEFSVEFPVLCPDDCTAFNDLSTNGPLTYAWEFPGGTPATSDVPTPFVCYPDPGLYPVTLTVGNDAGTDTFTLEDAVTVEVCTGSAEVPERHTSLAPNPSAGRIVITRSVPEENVITVYDGLGHLVMTSRIRGERTTIDTQAWPSGPYLLRIDGADPEAIRFVVE